MFVRKKRTKLKNGRTQTYAYLVENQWNPFRKKVQQKQIACLGNVAFLPHNSFIEKVILALDRFAKTQGFSSLSEGIILDNLADETKLSQSYDWGSLILVGHLFKKLSFSKIFKQALKKDKEKKLSFDKAINALTALLAFGLKSNSAISERATFLWYKNKVFLPRKQALAKDDFYRVLDFLARNKDEIERQYYYQNQNLFNQQLDLVLFDTTSIYYWGEKGEAALKTKQKPDEALLRYCGYSKDKRTDLKQLMVGVLMAEDAAGRPIPVAHEVFPGNQSDLVSLPEVLTKMKKKYQIGKLILVADKGMISEENLRNLEEQGLEYILGVRSKQLPPALKKALILNIEKEAMKKVKDNLYFKEFKIKDFLKTGSIWPHPRKPNKKINGKKAVDELVNTIYKNLDFYKSRTGSEKKDKEDIRRRILKRRYFVCFNPFVAEDNKNKRKFFKKIIANKIKYQQNKSWLMKNGYKKYLKLIKLDLQLDEERLDQEKHYDGKWILVTNSQIMNPRLAAIRYKSLRFVEQSFKELKSLVKIRPIYHFKEERIKAHIFVAFLTLILKWYVYQQLDSFSKATGRRFIEKINKLQALAVDQEIPLFVRSCLDKETINNLGKLKMKIPSKVIVDKRSKPKVPPRKAGRPRGKPNPNQQKLI